MLNSKFALDLTLSFDCNDTLYLGVDLPAYQAARRLAAQDGMRLCSVLEGRYGAREVPHHDGQLLLLPTPPTTSRPVCSSRPVANLNLCPIKL
jgi:hypothetical protein